MRIAVAAINEYTHGGRNKKKNLRTKRAVRLFNKRGEGIPCGYNSKQQQNRGIKMLIQLKPNPMKRT